MLISGCIKIAPKMEKLAEVEARVTAQVGAQGNDFAAKLFETETRIESKIEQKIGQVTGGNINNGMFSGGALYVTIVCVTLIVSLVLALFIVIRQKNAWRSAYGVARGLVNEKAALTRDLHERGLSHVEK
jgi:hypothetical protein